jgi:hypothetical protein
MESLTGPSDSPSAADSGDTSTSRTIRTQDRVTLGKSESLKVDGWIAQVNESTRGFLALSRSDIVNYLVRSVATDLTHKSLVQIRFDHYDPIRHINWIAPQIKAAVMSGDVARVAELQVELRTVELPVVRDPVGIQGGDGAASTARRRKAKESVEEVRKYKDDSENYDTSRGV